MTRSGSSIRTLSGTFSIGAGGSVVIRETTGGAAGVNAVPELSRLALLIAGGLGLLAGRLRHRNVQMLQE